MLRRTGLNPKSGYFTGKGAGFQDVKSADKEFHNPAGKNNAVLFALCYYS